MPGLGPGPIECRPGGNHSMSVLGLHAATVSCAQPPNTSASTVHGLQRQRDRLSWQCDCLSRAPDSDAADPHPHPHMPSTPPPVVALFPRLLGQLSMSTPGALWAGSSCHMSSFSVVFNLLCSLSQPLLIFLFCCLIHVHVAFIFRKL